MTTNVDLKQLAVRRDETGVTTKSGRPWHIWTRIILPGVVLAGFVAVVGWAARDHLLPARSVTVVPVVTTYVDVQGEGTPHFQAAGWIEPRPTAVLVTALAEGVVDKLLVVEGQKLKAGDPVALLIQEDAKLALQTAEADRGMREAELEQANATLAIARSFLPAELQAARSKHALAKQSFDSRNELFERGATSLLSVPTAKSELDMAASKVAELEIRQGAYQGQSIQPFAEAEANVKASKARLKQATTSVAAARLRLDRTTIKAPVDGQVITLVARPGQRLMGQAPLGMPEASTVITMFDPKTIQVRADVRLEEVPKVQPGQLVKIETPVTAAPLDGEVLQITSQADIQKNTLQVKVAVKSPPPTLRPDMLVQATFLAMAPPKGADDEKQTMRLMIPKQLVESTEGNTHVWVADLANKVARKKAVKLGRSNGDFVEVIQGLNAADRLIVDGRGGLSDGQRIDVAFADAGVESIRTEGGALPKRLRNPAEQKEKSGKH